MKLVLDFASQGRGCKKYEVGNPEITITLFRKYFSYVCFIGVDISAKTFDLVVRKQDKSNKSKCFDQTPVLSAYLF